MTSNPALYESFLAELQKIAASKGRLSISKARSGRRSLSVSTLLKKDKEGTLFKKHAWKDQIPGGLADTKTPADFKKPALQQGVKVESEHTSSKSLAKEIAMDHLTEDPGYYPKLKRMEKEGGVKSAAKEHGALKTEHKLHGHVVHQGLPLAIENDKGSVRKGVDKDGKKWRTVFKHPYGFIKNTEGKDGEEIDAYVGPNKSAPHAFVVHQRNLDGRGHDEDKVMLGFDSKDEARSAYLDHYNKVGPKLLGPISTITVDELKRKLEEKRKHTKLATASLISPYVDRDAQPEPGKRGDVPSMDGTNPGTVGSEKTEDGRGSATTLPTNGAQASSGTGATTRL